MWAKNVLRSWSVWVHRSRVTFVQHGPFNEISVFFGAIDFPCWNMLGFGMSLSNGSSPGQFPCAP